MFTRTFSRIYSFLSHWVLWVFLQDFCTSFHTLKSTTTILFIYKQNNCLKRKNPNPSTLGSSTCLLFYKSFHASSAKRYNSWIWILPLRRSNALLCFCRTVERSNKSSKFCLMPYFLSKCRRFPLAKCRRTFLSNCRRNPSIPQNFAWQSLLHIFYWSIESNFPSKCWTLNLVEV